MDEYKSVQNLSKLGLAAGKMLRAKFNISVTDDKLKLLITNISQDVEDEYDDASLKINELNNITLSKIKQLVQAQAQAQTQKKKETPDQKQSNDDIILAKVRELEAQRRVQTTTDVSCFKVAPVSTTTSVLDTPSHQVTGLQQQSTQESPQQIVHHFHQPNNVQFKTFIINSASRDWIKFPNRNNLKFNVPLSPQNSYNFYTDCILFPIYVKTITSYVLANFSDGVTSFTYTFVPSASGSNWDVWKTSDNAEKLCFNNKQWSVKFFDFLNNELDLGSDDVNIVEAACMDDNHFVVKYDKHMQGSLLPKSSIMIGNNTVYCKRIIDHSADDKLITIDKNNLTLANFIDAKLMDTSQQFSIIIKYHFAT
jgi:hypothetical protein